MFWKVIDRLIFGPNREQKIDLLLKTNPDRFYVENIRAFFNISYREASFYCEQAVREGTFRKKFAFTCPQCDRVILSVDNETQAPEQITCSSCETLESETYSFSKNQLKSVPFYQLVTHA